ncbi:hypothetical protein FKM82_027999, partial [Ascaphus truei]
GDHRLSMLLSQSVGSQPVRELLTMQLVDWEKLQVDCFIQEERMRVFTLLSGTPVWHSSDKRSINVCSQLDWKRTVAIHLWYMLPPTASIAQALTVYEEAFQVRPLSPPHCNHPPVVHAPSHCLHRSGPDSVRGGVPGAALISTTL